MITLQRAPHRVGTRWAVFALTAMTMATTMATLAACGGGEPLVLTPAASEGREIANSNGCGSCHGRNGQGVTAPSWQGIYMTRINIEGGDSVLVDDEYLYRSIADPQAEIVRGWTLKMPENELNDEEIASIITYIKELT